MHFEDFSSFLDMAGYGLYVWLSFGAASISLLVLWLDSFFSKQTLLTQVLTEQNRQARIKSAAEHSATAQQSAAAEKSATAQQSATEEQRTKGQKI